MEDGVEGFNARDGNAGFLCKLQRSSEVGFNLHRSLSFEIHVHSAVVVLWLCHLLHRCFPVVGRECAALCFRENKQLIDQAGDECADAHFLEQLGVVGRFEQNAGRVERNGTVKRN